MGVVDDMARQRGNRVRGDGEADPQKSQYKQQPAQNFTFGAACASGAAVNSAIGLLAE